MANLGSGGLKGPFAHEICALALAAGRAIMEIYAGEIAVELKSDASPLTLADRAANAVIVKGLKKLSPEIPIVSEEEALPPQSARAGFARFWLVDPLDGTKEFIKRNGEFTVNIALVEGGRPVVGVVHAPAINQTFVGGPGLGAVKSSGEGGPAPIAVRQGDEREGLTVVKSRSHPSAELDTFLAGKNVRDSLDVGSSLKFCVIAEGRADLYARFGPTMEWDTAAGHAVLLGAGGKLARPDGSPFLYNKPDLRNGPFIATGG